MIGEALAQLAVFAVPLNDANARKKSKAFEHRPHGLIDEDAGSGDERRQFSQDELGSCLSYVARRAFVKIQSDGIGTQQRRLPGVQFRGYTADFHTHMIRHDQPGQRNEGRYVEFTPRSIEVKGQAQVGSRSHAPAWERTLATLRVVACPTEQRESGRRAAGRAFPRRSVGTRTRRQGIVALCPLIGLLPQVTMLSSLFEGAKTHENSAG